MNNRSVTLPSPALVPSPQNAGCSNDVLLASALVHLAAALHRLAGAVDSRLRHEDRLMRNELLDEVAEIFDPRNPLPRPMVGQSGKAANPTRPSVSLPARPPRGREGGA